MSIRSGGPGSFPAADATRVVSVIPASFGAPPQFDVLTVATGARTRLAHARSASPTGLALASGMLVYFDVITAADGAETFGVWRIDLTTARPDAVKLDEFPSPGGFGGGDTIDPWPSPQTNGSDVVWLRTRAGQVGGRTHEIVATRGIRAPQVIHSGPQQPFFALDERGRVAIVTGAFAGDRDSVLSLYDGGVTRQLARRTADQGGLPGWAVGRIAWFNSWFSVRGASRVDLIDPGGGASATFAPPAGCSVMYPATRRHIQVSCLGGLTSVHDLVTGKIQPLSRILLASREALLMRSTAEFNAGEDAWLHAAVLPP
jgi:hypothetical protein